MIFPLLQGIDSLIEKDKYEFWLRLLIKYDTTIHELGVKESLIWALFVKDEGEDIDIDEIENADYYFYDIFLDDRQIEIFEKFILDKDKEIASKAAIFLAGSLPDYFLKQLPYYQSIYSIKDLSDFEKVIEPACLYILSELGDRYYGEMCPGWLYNVEKGDADIEREYSEQKALWLPILKSIKLSEETVRDINYNLNSLKKFVIEEDDDPFKNYHSSDPNQLSLDL
ncbi:hypothetical protein QNH98_01775 [Myroides sp. mNGS23_01]|nr:hypothetical protein [Myroides sp. mNGS23_01]WHT39459.1 hypothetical protein QNH98_01775 [Myroides sp. mNGS23_01]